MGGCLSERPCDMKSFPPEYLNRLGGGKKYAPNNRGILLIIYTNLYFAFTQRTIIELVWFVPPVEIVGLPVALFDHAR